MYPFGVSVHTLEPGAFKTHLTDSEIVASGCQRIYDSLDQQIKEQYGQEFVDKCKKKWHSIPVRNQETIVDGLNILADIEI